MNMGVKELNRKFKITAMLIIMLIIALGYISKRFNIIREEDGEGIAKVIFNFSLPALAITTFSTITADFSLIIMPVMGLPPWLRRRPRVGPHLR
jgi:predicted permease